MAIDAVSVLPEEAKERWPLMNGEDVIRCGLVSRRWPRVSPSDVCAALVKAAKALRVLRSSRTLVSLGF